MAVGRGDCPTMDDDPRLTTLRALAHPARLQILSLLTGTAMSAAEVAREIGTTQANASYHLRRLHQAGEVELVEEVSIRGGRARRFRCPPVADWPPPSTPTDDQRGAGPEERGFFTALAQELLRRSLARQRDGRAINTDAELWVDPAVWDDAVARITAVSRDLHARARPPRTPGTVRTSTTLALFTMDPAARPAPAEGDA